LKTNPKHEYDPEKIIMKISLMKDGYAKRYIKEVDNTLIYDKIRKVFAFKRDGFLIIDSKEKKNEDKTKKTSQEYFVGTIFKG
jgi:hypothetical protein